MNSADPWNEIMKIKIVDINGNNISYKKAIVRFNVSILSISLLLGFLISLFRKDKSVYMISFQNSADKKFSTVESSKYKNT